MASTLETFTDMEGLLSDDQEQGQKRYRQWRFGSSVAGVLMVVGIVATALVMTKRRQLETFMAAGTIVLDAEVPEGCFKVGMYFAGPFEMEGQPKTLEANAKYCQTRCAAAEGCAHFTFWPDGGCLLTTNHSHLKAAAVTYSGATVGPKSCDNVAAYEVFVPPGTSVCDGSMTEGPSAGSDECSMRCDEASQCNFYSIWHTGGQNWCRLTASCDTLGEQPRHNITIYKKKPKWSQGSTAIAAAKPGPSVNGTECSAYPACVAVSIASGSCCPNADGVALGCCDGFPKPMVAVTVAAGSECSAWKGCAALNLTEGGCCPTPDGVRLGCCDA